MEKIGIFGGSFNPPHFGHLHPAREAVEQLGLAKLLFLPSGAHPLKKQTSLASATHRLVMTELIIATEPLFEVCKLDLQNPGICYTVDTLAKLAHSYPDHELVFIVGGDIISELHHWKEWQKIFLYAHMAMLVRPGTESSIIGEITNRQVAGFLAQQQVSSPKHLTVQPDGRHRFIQLMVTPVDISATQIRQRLQNGDSCHNLTTAAVREYINANQLYVSESDNDQ